jgi:carbon storage regulator
MLVLSRKLGEKIVINGDITLIVVAVEKDRVRLGFEAPRDVAIFRQELTNGTQPRELDADLAAKPAEWKGKDVGPKSRVSSLSRF